MEPKTVEVLVTKAAINLRAGESLGQFASAVQAAARAHVVQKLNLPAKKNDESYWSAYVEEILSTMVIVYVYQTSQPTRYYAFTYTRDANGNFSFGDTVEVERVTSWRAKTATASIAKSKLATIADTGWTPKRAPLVAAVEKRAESSTPQTKLPDAAFAVKVEKARYFSHHTASVKQADENFSVDVPALRNALVGLESSDLPLVQVQKARQHLEAHARAVLASRAGSNPTLVRKSAKGNYIEALDELIRPAVVTKSAKGGNWVRAGADFWGALA